MTNAIPQLRPSRSESWGCYPKVVQSETELNWLSEPREYGQATSYLPFGLGRSYGDSCLNDGGALLLTARLNRFISFNPESGILCCEAGVTIHEILSTFVSRGWFVPVTPGTQFVTVGGAIANDVHGKNHHLAGTFGRHVIRLGLERSDGQRLICSPTENAELFQATIAGLGLTGIILWAEIKLRKIDNQFIDQELIKFGSLEEFVEISEQSSAPFEHTVAWLDCVAGGSNFGRGIFIRGNHRSGPSQAEVPATRQICSVPFNFPSFVLNRLTIGAFNFLYYHKQLKKRLTGVVHYRPFFHPLDAIGNWNRIYGRRGFFQFQCVVPGADNNRPLRLLLKEIVASGQGSFLAVLKEFGELSSPGLISFPRRGMTLALDFPNRGVDTLNLLRRLDSVVSELGGAIYPAKDATMSGKSFKQYYPGWERFSKYIDPKFSSSFWRRVMAGDRA